MSDKPTGVLGRQSPDVPDPPAIHTRAMAGVPPGGSPPMQGPASATLATHFFQRLHEAAFGPEQSQEASKVRTKVNAELSSLADQISQLPVTDAERNAVVRRLCSCIKPAVKLLDADQEAAMQWMKTPNVELKGKVPLEMVLHSDDDAHEVAQLIGRIQYGVFA